MLKYRISSTVFKLRVLVSYQCDCWLCSFYNYMFSLSYISLVLWPTATFLRLKRYLLHDKYLCDSWHYSNGINSPWGKQKGLQLSIAVFYPAWQILSLAYSIGRILIQKLAKGIWDSRTVFHWWTGDSSSVRWQTVGEWGESNHQVSDWSSFLQ